MRLSICIPTYDRCDQLLATLERIRLQLAAACEIVVADNGSRDDTVAAVQSWVDSHPSIPFRLLARGANAGFDRNLLDVVAEARGHYCWLLGDDDLPRAGAIQAILGAIDRRPGVPHLLLNYRRRNAIGGRIDKSAMVSLSRDILPATASDFFFYHCPRPSYFKLLGTNIITLSANVVHRAHWLAEVAAAAPWVGHSMVHVFVITAMLAHQGPGLFLAESQFDYTCNNARPWPNDVWQDYRLRVYGHLRELGYDESRIGAAETDSITYSTWRDVARAWLGPWLGRSLMEASG